MNFIVAVRVTAMLAIPLALTAATAPASAQDRYSYGPGPYGPRVYGYGPRVYGYGPRVYGYGPGPYGYGPPVYYGPMLFGYPGNSPNNYPIGTKAWWRAMERDGRTGTQAAP